MIYQKGFLVNSERPSGKKGVAGKEGKVPKKGKVTKKGEGEHGSLVAQGMHSVVASADGFKGEKPAPRRVETLRRPKRNNNRGKETYDALQEGTTGLGEPGFQVGGEQEKGKEEARKALQKGVNGKEGKNHDTGTLLKTKRHLRIEKNHRNGGGKIKKRPEKGNKPSPRGKHSRQNRIPERKRSSKEKKESKKVRKKGGAHDSEKKKNLSRKKTIRERDDRGRNHKDIGGNKRGTTKGFALKGKRLSFFKEEPTTRTKKWGNWREKKKGLR